MRTRMKICIFGAGAIGGLIGAKLAAKGEAEVSLVARGPHLAAMQANGLTLKEKAARRTSASPRPTIRRSSARRIMSILALKAHSVPGRARQHAAAARPGHRRRHGAERRALVVFLQARRRA